MILRNGILRWEEFQCSVTPAVVQPVRQKEYVPVVICHTKKTIIWLIINVQNADTNVSTAEDSQHARTRQNVKSVESFMEKKISTIMKEQRNGRRMQKSIKKHMTAVEQS